MTLVEFLLARIAEDEVIAEIAGDVYGGHERVSTFRPKRLFAECKAKRLVIHHTQPSFFPLHPANHGCGKCNALRALALPYADHPDFIPDWHL